MEQTIDFFSGGGRRATSPSLSRDALIEKHYPMVRSVVGSMLSYLPSCADAEELHSAGVIGLIAAVDRYDQSKAETFNGYVATRIRGAVLDELRRIDLLPRTSRQKTRAIKEASERLEQKLGRAPEDTEVARELGMSLEEFRKFQLKARPVRVMSIDGAADASDEDEMGMHETLAAPERRTTPEQVADSEIIDLITHEMQHLPERYQKILAMYYYEGMRLSEIAEVYGVTEARICQIHKQALAKIRKALPVEA